MIVASITLEYQPDRDPTEEEREELDNQIAAHRKEVQHAWACFDCGDLPRALIAVCLDAEVANHSFQTANPMEVEPQPDPYQWKITENGHELVRMLNLKGGRSQWKIDVSKTGLQARVRARYTMTKAVPFR